jgi:putative PIN family toxin of toxin-antitoxin system
MSAAWDDIGPTASAGSRNLVLDTNIVLDVFVFEDVAAKPIREGLTAGTLRWIATAPMRDELERVLSYPQIAKRLAFCGLPPASVLGEFDRHAQIVGVPAKAPVTCSDPDDQKFIDLAVQHRCTLLSKDQDVISMKKRLQVHAVTALLAI